MSGPGNVANVAVSITQVAGGAAGGGGAAAVVVAAVGGVVALALVAAALVAVAYAAAALLVLAVVAGCAALVGAGIWWGVRTLSAHAQTVAPPARLTVDVRHSLDGTVSAHAGASRRAKRALMSGRPPDIRVVERRVPLALPAATTGRLALPAGQQQEVRP